MNRSPIHRAFTLTEMLVSLIVLGAAIAALLQLVAVGGQQRRRLAERRVALQEVANQAERIALLPWADTAPDKLVQWQPSADLAAVLPAATCQIAVSDEAGLPSTRKIRLEVGWANAAGQSVEPVSLTVWRIAPEAAP
jgi:prepilin-type N-terminal cleavage/methylation domain-containing protein